MAYLPGRKRKYIQTDNEKTVKGDIDVDKLKSAYVALEQAYREAKESQIEVILDLAIVAEFKDTDTGNHILRISDYATAVTVRTAPASAPTVTTQPASLVATVGRARAPVLAMIWRRVRVMSWVSRGGTAVWSPLGGEVVG